MVREVYEKPPRFTSRSIDHRSFGISTKRGERAVLFARVPRCHLFPKQRGTCDELALGTGTPCCAVCRRIIARRRSPGSFEASTFGPIVPEETPAPDHVTDMHTLSCLTQDTELVQVRHRFFLYASSHLYYKVNPSVGQSIRP